MVSDGFDFFGIVRDEPDGFEAEELEDGAGQFVVAEIAVEAELLIGFDGIGAFVLQLVGAKLVEQADASAFLQFVDQQAAAFGGDAGEGDVQLGAAIAAQAVEHVTGEALGMDAE
jgi:hypothetical protein